MDRRKDITSDALDLLLRIGSGLLLGAGVILKRGQSISGPNGAAGIVTVATVISPSRDDRPLERAIERVAHEPAATAVHWSARNLESAD